MNMQGVVPHNFNLLIQEILMLIKIMIPNNTKKRLQKKLDIKKLK